MSNKNSPLREDLEKLPHMHQVRFAVFCARQVIHLVEPKYLAMCTKAIETVELFLEGRASKEECAYAANAYAANAAAYAANDKQTIIKAQWDTYDQLLNGDRYFEEIVLK